MEPLLGWSAPEFARVERTAMWYITTIVLAVLFCIFALWQKNYLFFLFIVIAEAMMLLMGRQRPEEFDYVITREGIAVDERMVYTFKTLKAFALSDDNLSEYIELVLETNKQLAQHIRLLIPRELEGAAREALAPRLAEFTYNEGLSDILMKRFGL